MSELEKKMKRVCFTGHRPDKLEGRIEDAKAYLKDQIEKAIADGFQTFICGMCPGIDILAGEAVLKAKKTHPDIHLIAAMPYPRFAYNWENWGNRVWNVCAHADLIQNVSREYTGKDVFQKRNVWMVDHSSRLIAYWDGTPGGTRNTVVYGRQAGIQIINRFKEE